MNLKQFKSWKLLYEDDDLCFSKAVNHNDATNVFFITLFNPHKMSTANKYLLEEHLHNYIAIFEEDGKLHLILKAHEGRSIKKFISKSNLEYHDRVQIVYEYLNLIELYDVFPNSIKIQLLDEEQLLISDEGLLFRELVDYTLSTSFSSEDVFKQLGKTIDLILSDAEGYHSQFIDNLLLGNHKFESIKELKDNFKDIFIFEKTEALDSINYEYTIILNDLDAGPPLKLTKEDLNLIKQKNSIEKESTHNDTSLQYDDLQQELMALLKENRVDLNEQVEPLEEQVEPFEEQVEPLEEQVEPIIQPVESVKTIDLAESIELNESIDLIESDELIYDCEFTEYNIKTPTTEQLLSKDTKSFKAIFLEDDKMPDSLPKSLKQRLVEDDDDLFHEDMSLLFDDEEDLLAMKKSTLKSKWILIVISIILVLIIGFWGIKRVINSEPIAANFSIESLHDNRVAFMNTSTGDNIKAYSWEIFYASTLVQTFDDKNLFPVFDTEGIYDIKLKVQDKKGTWSDAFSKEYEFTLSQEAANP